MTWVKLDDAILDNRKIAKVGPLGFALHVAGIVHCGRNLSDGFVTYGAARRLLDTQFVPDDERLEVWTAAVTSGMSGDDAETMIERVLKWICAAGLWTEVPGGYEIHDYLAYNPSREQVLAERAKKQAAGRAGGQASAQARAQADAEAPAQAESKPVPVPVPVPVSEPKPEPTTSSKSLVRSDKRIAKAWATQNFERFWTAYPRRSGKVKAREKFEIAALKMLTSSRGMEELIVAAQRFAADPNLPEMRFIPLPATWLNQGRWDDEPQPVQGNGHKRVDRAMEIHQQAQQQGGTT